MAFLYITEFTTTGFNGPGTQGLQVGLGNQVPADIAVLPPVAQQKIAIGGSSVVSAALNPATRLVRVQTDVVCHVDCGTAPVADITEMRMPADSTEYFGVVPGLKIAVIAGV